MTPTDTDPPAVRLTAAGLRRLPRDQQDAILAKAAALAEDDYRNDPELTASEPNGMTRTMTDRIAVRPHVHFGKPCVAGTRITVQSVLELVREGVPTPDIIRDYYPDLTAADIRACVRYAIDHLP
ncbi:MAG: DUF433 domain-containing protein [Gemmataceae bacterium]|nr:DUF433 domain-containing protein [Gemmataceae bacterium]